MTRSNLLLPALALTALLSGGVVPARAQTANLIPNGDFSAKDSLQGWRVAFPYESWYANNAGYVKAVARAPAPGGAGPCVVIDLPPGIAGNQGGKIESAFVQAVPGATYRVSVDCLTWDFSAKLHAEAYTTDPSPTPKADKFRVPAGNGLPALVMCYRAQLPDPPAGAKTWGTVSREFTLPEKVTVAGHEQKPEYLSVKAVVYAATPNGGKSYFARFRLSRVK